MSLYNLTRLQRLTAGILLSRDERDFIADMPELQGNEWEAKNLPRPPWVWGDGEKIKALKDSIRASLNELHGEYCIYCGMDLNVTSGNQIEHIAPKARYPKFTFERFNLVLACSLCNGFEKKERAGYWDTVAQPSDIYEDCEFRIVHPYFDEPEDHLELNRHGGKVLIKGLSAKGLRSIETFLLDGEPLTNQRGTLVIRQMYNLNPAMEALVESTISRVQ